MSTSSGSVITQVVTEVTDGLPLAATQSARMRETISGLLELLEVLHDPYAAVRLTVLSCDDLCWEALTSGDLDMFHRGVRTARKVAELGRCHGVSG